MTTFFAIGIKSCRSKANFAPTWLGWQDSTVGRAAPGILPARDTPRFACGTALALPAKNVPPAHFINAETFSGSNPFTFPKSKKSRKTAQVLYGLLKIKNSKSAGLRLILMSKQNLL